MFSYETCQLSKENYLEEHLRTSASKSCLIETPTQVFSREFFELFKNSYFVEDLRKAGSETPVRRSLYDSIRKRL